MAARYPLGSRAGKRLMDVGLSSAGLVVVGLPVALVALVVHGFTREPVIFRQRRPGRNGRLFELYKFRTMTEDRDLDGTLLPDRERITSLGRVLRRSSLDELPELLNVLKGDMSLVGPRPLLPEYLDRYTSDQARRHEVRPGITGWAQVNGRNAIGWDERFELDVWYVDNWTVWLDVKILWMTVEQVIRGTGITAEGHATMPAFTGGDADVTSHD